ncbi:SRPBCC family protein [Streptomyces sp. 6N223]|uniref:SRPBCC family protein n=1 Tax=Streptomyces sp. 6N223 TaxID=3457412 RepID=UPI003FD45375
MTDMTDKGSYIEFDGRPALRFERTYAHPVERVWAAVSEPDELAHWFPQRVEIEPRKGGSITFFDDTVLDFTGTVLRYDPPRGLSFSWGGDEMHFDLTPREDGGCTLTMINVLEARDTAARTAAGWTVCLGELNKRLAGEPLAGPDGEGAAPWEPIYEWYVAAGMPSGAPIPGRE